MLTTTLFGRNLRAKRLSRGLSLDDVADSTGITKRTLSRLENAKSGIPHPKTAAPICRLFNCSFDEFMSVSPELEMYKSLEMPSRRRKKPKPCVNCGYIRPFGIDTGKSN